MYKLNPTKESFKFIRDLEPKQFKKVMNKVLSLLVDAKSADSGVLQGHEELLRVDIGEFRIVYRLDNQNIVSVLIVGRRNGDEVYGDLIGKC